jgi:predicted DNA-binding protein (MmcQ/YjbR family)
MTITGRAGSFEGSGVKRIFAALRQFALGLPETREDLPWGESAIKVKGKTFLFMRCDAAGLGLSVKLPQSGPFALDRSFAEPTGYGLGASGWVTASFAPKAKPPVDLLKGWIEESYRAVAPRKVLAAAAKPAKNRPARVNRRRPRPH